MDRRRLGAWAGMIGPTLFIAVFTVEGWLRPGYEALRMYISELALGPRGWIQNVNFVIMGALSLVFARGVAAEFREGKASWAGPLLLRIISVAFLASGFFVMDPAATPREQKTRHGRLHDLFGALVFSLAPVTCLVFLRRFRQDPKWHSLQWPTLAAGTTTAAAVILMAVGPTRPPAAPNAFNRWIGAIQRTALVPYLIWQFIFALALWRRT